MGRIAESQGYYFNLTMEYLVVQNRYRELFLPKEIQEAEIRLAWFPTKRVDRDFYRGPEPSPL